MPADYSPVERLLGNSSTSRALRVGPSIRGSASAAAATLLLVACQASSTASSSPADKRAKTVRQQGLIAEPAPGAPEREREAAPPETVAKAMPVESAASESSTADPSDKTDNPQRLRKVLMVGDSLAATGFGVLLEKRLDKHSGVDCARRAKSATGLARPDFFNWFKEGKKAVRRHDPELVLVIIGGNDGQALVLDPKRSKKRVRWKSEQWDAAYASRVLEFVDSMTAQGRKVLWLGLPRTDTEQFERKLEKIRAVTKEALLARPSTVTYFDTTPLLLDARGRLKKTIRHGSRSGPLRQADGIHFTMLGSHYFAEQLYPVVLNALGLEDVQTVKKGTVYSK